MGFLKKVGKLAKTAVKAYATYQTGGLAGVALSAAQKVAKKRGAGAAARALPGGVMVDSGMTSAELLQQQFPQLQTQQVFLPALATAARTALPALGSMARSGALVKAAKGLGSLAKTVGVGVGIGAATDYLTRAGKPRRAINPRTGKPYRRMNVGNAKAAKRAIRRIKGVRRLLHDIERQLPKQSVKHTGGYCPPRKKKC